MVKVYSTKEEIVEKAEEIVNRSLRDVIPVEAIIAIENLITENGLNRKGLLGGMMEKYFFDINPGNVSEPDFPIAGVELKTTPLKTHSTNQYVSKERLVFSMIDYGAVIGETWETSSFLRKNKILLLMFYLWVENESLLDYEFKFAHLLNLLEDISIEDVYQIRKDWEFIVGKIKRGEAHLLSEGDTYYLGACTKAADSSVLRNQPMNTIQAKPRAFSFKQKYINYLIQTKLLGKKADTDSIFKKIRRVEAVDDAIREKFAPFINKTDGEIRTILGWNPAKISKNYKRLLANHILTDSGSNNVEELEKANVTMKVITLESSGSLTESISFPAFDYKDLLTQVWYDEVSEKMADFHVQLESKKFLFVVFQKVRGADAIVLKKIQFWNFPMRDLDEAEKVFSQTVDCIKEGRYYDMPKMSENEVAHVRPHGRNAADTIETPQHTQEVKRCFWLNAKYIQKALEI